MENTELLQSFDFQVLLILSLGCHNFLFFPEEFKQGIFLSIENIVIFHITVNFSLIFL